MLKVAPNRKRWSFNKYEDLTIHLIAHKLVPVTYFSIRLNNRIISPFCLSVLAS